MSRQRQQTWWRMPAATPAPIRPRRGPSPFRWAAPYWAVGFGVAALLQLEVVPLKQWLRGDSAPTVEIEVPSVEAAEPPIRYATPAPPPIAWLPEHRGGSPRATFQSFGAPPKPVEPEEPPALAPAADPEPEPRARRRRKKRRTAKPRPRRRAEPIARSRPAPAPAPAPRKKKRRKAVSVSGGKSCSAAIASYRENVKMGDSSTPADLTAGQYGAVLNRGNYFSHCGVPSTMRIHICAAVQNGVAIGVTVTTTPGSASVAGCVAGAVRGLSFPSHPRMDVTRTTFE